MVTGKLLYVTNSYICFIICITIFIYINFIISIITLIYISPAIYTTIRVINIIKPTALIINTIVSLIKQYIIKCIKLSNNIKKAKGV